MTPTFQRGRLRTMIAAMGLTLAFGAAVAHASEASVARLLAQKYPSLTSVQPQALPVPGLYEVTIAGQTAYTDEKVTYLLVGGELLAGDGKTVRNITRERAASAPAPVAPVPSTAVATIPAPAPAVLAASLNAVPSSILVPAISNVKASPHGPLKVVKKQSDVYDTLPFDKAIAVVYGNGERKLAMFADPDCPFCQKIEGTMNERGAALNATVYVFLWPLTIHPHSNEKADYLWCQPDHAKAWTSWMVFANAMNNSTPNANEEDVWTAWKKAWLAQTHLPAAPVCSTPSPREEVRALAQKYGLTVTPTLIFENGAAVNGGTDAHGLENGWNFVYKGTVSNE